MINYLFQILRKYTQCKFGVHWRMKYDSGIANDITSAGKCGDCGHEQKEFKRPPPPAMPPVKRGTICRIYLRG